MANEVPILEAFKIHDPEVEASVRDIIINYSNILNLVPMGSVERGFARSWLERDLNASGGSGIAFRAINEDYTNTYNALKRKRSTIKPMGTSIRIDHLTEEQFPGALVDQVTIFLQDLMPFVDNAFINGNSVTNPRQFDGLKVLLGDSGSHTEGSGSSITINTSEATFDSFLDRFDNALDKMKGQANAAFMSPTIYNAIQSGARKKGANTLGTAIDFLGRRVLEYQGVPFYRLGKDDLGNDILPSTETDSTSSIYICRLDPESGVSGLSARGVQLLPDNGGNFFRTVIDATFGIKVVTNSAVRLMRVKKA